jgi:hypothetical protein
MSSRVFWSLLSFDLSQLALSFSFRMGFLTEVVKEATAVYLTCMGSWGFRGC